MRVVMAAIRYPPAPGGAEAHVAALAERLVARGHDVEVHTSDLYTEYPFVRKPLPAEVGGVRVVRHRALRVAGAWTAMPRMWGALREAAARAEVVHAHSYGYFQTLAAARAAGRAGTPFVFTPHFHPPWSMEGGGGRRALRRVFDPLLGQRVLRAADRIIAVSTSELDEMARHLDVPRGRVVVIPNGFDAAAYASTPSPEPFRAHLDVGDAPLVVFAGRLASNKGLPHLVRAFAVVATERPEARLVLAGEDQGWRARLEEQARGLGLADRVLFTGHLDPALYRSALAAADVFALPSEWEAFGIVLAEAMACGVPCVATSVGGARDVVVDGETGLLVPYGDDAALAKAIARLLSDRALSQRLGRAGRERALKEYAWDAVVDRTLALYASLTAA